MVICIHVVILLRACHYQSHQRDSESCRNLSLIDSSNPCLPYHVMKLYGHVLLPDSRITLISLVIPRAIDVIWNCDGPLGFF